MLGICEFLAGHDGADRIAGAVSLRGTGSFPETYTTPRVTMGLRSMWAGELDAARSTLEAVLDHLAERGLYTLAAEPHEYLGEIECRAGQYELAARHAATEIEIKLGAGFEERHALDLYPQALVEALRGDVTSARAYATQGLAWSQRGDLLYANCNRAVLGFLELSLGRFAEAREHLDPVVRFLREMGVREPCVIPVHADAIEAQIGVGDLDAASDAAGGVRGPGAGDRACHGRSRQRRDAGRCCSPRAAMPRRLRSCSSAPSRSIDGSRSRSSSPARCSRRARSSGGRDRSRPRGGPFSRRSAIFEELGAPLWAAKARAELARIGGRAPAGDGLTPTERRIAELVAEGKTNKEVALILVVAERTVESALTQIYRKLDVRSRTELAHKLAGTA